MDLFKINSMSTQLRSLQSLYKANQKASLHQERLSTGKRVNSAQDDLASFSIANNIKTSKKGAETALQNISNAKSILSIVEAGQQKQVELLQEIKAKIIQLKDPSLNNNQRQSISESINSLKAEIANVGTQLLLFNCLGSDETCFPHGQYQNSWASKVDQL